MYKIIDTKNMQLKLPIPNYVHTYVLNYTKISKANIKVP